MPTFVDMFAGAGGFSEGFLQAEKEGKYYDFLLASDINPTCEVTHRMRYNKQLGLNTVFLTKDITDTDFIEELLAQIKDKCNTSVVDVLTGGPPCQSFSLAGERKKNDKKDDLFSYYLKVITALKPKYFVMENVYGILTKDKGRVKDRIIKEITNILDDDGLEKLISYISTKEFFNLIPKERSYEFNISSIILKIRLEKDRNEFARRVDYLRALEGINSMANLNDSQKSLLKKGLLEVKNTIPNPSLVEFCKTMSDKVVETYRRNISIPEDERNVLRQAFSLIASQNNIKEISRKIRIEINSSQLKRSLYKERFDSASDFLELDSIIDIARKQCDKLSILSSGNKGITKALNEIKLALEILNEGAFETISRILSMVDNNTEEHKKLNELKDSASLYRTSGPKVLLSSDYGVPQNRQRVVIIGCRSDQPLIKSIPATVSPDERVVAGEAIGDLNYIGINDHPYKYNKKLEERFKKTKLGSIKRTVDGKPSESGKTFVEWSREGRLNPERFPSLSLKKPCYTKANSMDDYSEDEIVEAELHNHETSNHSQLVQDRYALMRKYKSFDVAKAEESDNPLMKTEKRDYTWLDPNKPSTTITTMADDYCHYGANRSLTVREMARLQSFDDSFVFQGKRSTGGEKRKVETPQFTQVGNAVPPLMARAIAMEILKNIK